MLPPTLLTEGDFYLPLTTVTNIKHKGTVGYGRIESGTYNNEKELYFYPSAITTKISACNIFEGRKLVETNAKAGE